MRDTDLLERTASSQDHGLPYSFLPLQATCSGSGLHGFHKTPEVRYLFRTNTAHRLHWGLTERHAWALGGQFIKSIERDSLDCKMGRGNLMLQRAQFILSCIWMFFTSPSSVHPQRQETWNQDLGDTSIFCTLPGTSLWFTWELLCPSDMSTATSSLPHPFAHSTQCAQEVRKQWPQDRQTSWNKIWGKNEDTQQDRG